jgi:DNA-binding beta-propeller fold protein YncE
VIDSATREVDTTIPLNEDADPYGMAIANNKLYVAGTWSGKVYVIDLDGDSPNYRKVIGSISVGEGAYDAIARADGAYVYISHDTADGKVSVINANTDSLET